MIGDAFGQILQRCWDAGVVPGAAFEVIEREDGYVGVNDALCYFTPFEELTPLDLWACEQVNGRALDIGCGAGRHSPAVQALGHETVGMDSSAGAVRVARERGVTALVGTFEDVPLNLGPFGSLLLLGNNLGLLGGRDNARAALERLAGAVGPGTRLVGSESPTLRTLHDVE
ncbi:methyltransferase family protein [Murinocardiopsis flavida]|uniref:Methyltransferase family protein n=1 Tax=Murinocardiopsis flavida TaxID=645275 RepID=A0A2P8CB88_9ACTN|nr:methyltransferase family protein [Murinocardiopsis flavida]